MSFFFQPWQVLVLILAAWINREQHKVIEYLRIENQILREQIAVGYTSGTIRPSDSGREQQMTRFAGRS
jgi:hypothetical protein